MSADRAKILDCAIDRLTMGQTVARCQEIIDQKGFGQQVSLNAAKLVAMHQDVDLRKVINQCALINADGQSIVWASRLLNDPLPERVAGIDLMHNLITLARRRDYGIYILGAKRTVLETAVASLGKEFPDLRIVGFRDGYFPESESSSVVAEIRDSGAQILFVAISSPRKERWLGRHGEELNVPLVMGVGGSIDIVAGITRRAPRLWQRLGFEWLYRLLQEPHRMFGRYLNTNVRFLVLVATAILSRRSSFF